MLELPREKSEYMLSMYILFLCFQTTAATGGTAKRAKVDAEPVDVETIAKNGTVSYKQ